MRSDPITIRIPRPLWYAFLVLLAIGVVLLGLSGAVERGTGAAERRADRYLSALVAGDAETAWSELTDRAQTIWGTFEAFGKAIESSDWSRFEYEITGVFCDDGICGVDLFLPNGVDSVPPMLSEGPTHYWWGSGQSLIFSDKFAGGGTDEARERGDNRARIVVVFGPMPWDDRGIT